MWIVLKDSPVLYSLFSNVADFPMSFKIFGALPLLFLAACAQFPAKTDVAAAEGNASLLGKKAPDWRSPTWLDSPPRELADFKGKVVLIRWWTAPGCPYCGASAPALNEFFRTYRKQGLEVLGFYHHKTRGPLELGAVREHARHLGFEFPIAVDPEWRTLREWWLNSGDMPWTSVSFLLDRQGFVRFRRDCSR